jgi:hypothetical protein
VSAQPTTDPRDAEIEQLRDRVADLEAQLAAQAQETAAIVAEAQEKLYWLERWHVDLDRVMRKRGALRALEMLRAARGVVWKVRRLKRRVLG